MAVSLSEWDSRQSQVLPVSLSRPHWAQWKSGSSGQSHRFSPCVPSSANRNTHGEDRPGKPTVFLNKHNTQRVHCILINKQRISFYLHQHMICSVSLLWFWEQTGHPSPCLHLQVQKLRSCRLLWRRKEKVVPNYLAIITLSSSERHIIALTCSREWTVPGNEILWPHGTGDDEGEGKHNGEAKEQGQEKDCSSPVGQFGKTQLLAALFLQLCCWWYCSCLCTIFSRLQRVALSGMVCGLHHCLNALLAYGPA